MNPLFQRLTLLTGSEAAEALEHSRVIVVGLGGVGSWCAEALVRSGIGNISLVDSDTVCVSNINRQVEALGSTIGRLKTESLEERLKDINPYCVIRSFPIMFSAETAEFFNFSEAGFVIDAIDTMPHKLDLVEAACASGTRFFSSMGMAQKLDPTLIRTADIWKTSGCPLARSMRQGLKKRNFSGHFTTVYSPERVTRHDDLGCTEKTGEKTPNGSAVTVTAAAGMILASLVIRDVCSRYAQRDIS